MGADLPGVLNAPPGGVPPSSCPSGDCPGGSGGPGSGGGGLPGGGDGGFPAFGNGGNGGGPSGSCPGSAGACGVNPAAGNLLLQTAPPGAGGYDPGSMFSYNSLAASAGSGSYGSGWTATYNRYLRQLSSTVALVVDSVGNVFTYTRPNTSTTRYTPPAGANNGLVATTAGGWTETQPDGLSYLYPAPTNQVAMLQAVQNRNGSLWTMTYDSTGTLLKSITDPAGRLTSFAYDTSNRLKSYQDVGGRITTFLVNSSGDLVQVTTPALCITSLRLQRAIC